MSPQKHDQGVKKRVTNAAALLRVQAKRETARADRPRRADDTPDDSRAEALERIQDTDWSRR